MGLRVGPGAVSELFSIGRDLGFSSGQRVVRLRPTTTQAREASESVGILLSSLTGNSSPGFFIIDKPLRRLYLLAVTLTSLSVLSRGGFKPDLRHLELR